MRVLDSEVSRLRLGARFAQAAGLAAPLALLAGCVEQAPEAPRDFEMRQWSLSAFCEATVRGVGSRDVETDYLAHVVSCENGGAAFEALKAQAVAARSYLYFKLETSGDIADGTSDQVYTCSRPPRDEHFRAVAETSGQVLRNRSADVTLASFYVAGAIPSTADCVPASGDRDPTNTERFVTYNRGRSGSEVEPTTLGHPANPRNRGCKSQNGANCLAQKGWQHEDILRSYYGEDVDFVVAEGECIEGVEPPPQCEIVVAGPETVIDESGPCFARTCQMGEAWWSYADGIGGASIATYTVDAEAPDCSGSWELKIGEPGLYRIEAHIPHPVPVSRQAPYTIRHGGQQATVALSQADTAGWGELGVFEFAAGGDQWVRLDDNTGEPYTGQDGIRVIFDAIRLIAVENIEPPLPEPEPSPEAEPGAEPEGGPAVEPEASAEPDGEPGEPEAGADVLAGVRTTRYEEGCAVAGAPEGRRPAGGLAWGVMLALGLALGRRAGSRAAAEARR